MLKKIPEVQTLAKLPEKNKTTPTSQTRGPEYKLEFSRTFGHFPQN
jgi:hypothetical protein